MRSVVIFSGGPDSTAAALWSEQEGFETELLTFQFKNDAQYGEIRSSMNVAAALGMKHTILDFKSPMQHFSSNVHILMHAGTTSNIQDKSREHRMPFGAAMIVSTAANFAIYNGIEVVIWGSTKDDASGGNYEYTREFCDDMSTILTRISGREFRVISPFSEMHKYEIVKTYFSNKEELFAATWSAKGGGRIQSGSCHASRARRIAARLAGIKDHTPYESEVEDWVFSEAEYADPSLIDPALLGPPERSER